MTRLKIIGILIFTAAMALAALFGYTNYLNKLNTAKLNIVKEQKEFTQEVAKNIFYIYRNKHASTRQLDESIRKFQVNMNKKDETFPRIDSVLTRQESDRIITLWNDFYRSVQKFRKQSEIITPYSNIVLEEVVKDIYTTNLILVTEFNKLIKLHQEDFQGTLERYKYIQYMLFFILVLLLLLLFRELQDVLAFIQKFLQTSKNIITNASIKAVKPIEVTHSSADIEEAVNNFNFLVHKINDSIHYSSSIMESACQSLGEVEKNIEDLLELVSVMEEDSEIDKELTKKEDILIQSFEELSKSILKLRALKTDFENLISHERLKNKTNVII
jgi:hypothetical protein